MYQVNNITCQNGKEKYGSSISGQPGVRPACKEIPEFIALQEQYAAKGLQFIGIAIDDQEPVKEYLAKTKINYPILIGGDTGIALAHQLGNIIDAVPFTVVVNQQGQIIHQHPGEFSREQIMEIINPLIK